MRVFKVNDCDWVAAPSREAAIAWYVREHVDEQFSSYEEAIDEPVMECSLDSEMYVDLGDKSLGKTAYRAAIERYLDAHNTEPFVVASTEY
jgi:hypothetical protein